MMMMMVMMMMVMVMVMVMVMMMISLIIMLTVFALHLQDWDSFEKDIVLIFNNAMTYNQKVTCDV
jgi:hypothetical protein